MVSPTLTVLLAFVCLARGQSLVKDPTGDTVMISYPSRGLWMFCKVNGTTSDEETASDGEGSESEAQKMAAKIRWTIDGRDIPEEFVSTRASGRSVLAIGNETVAHDDYVGTIKCEYESQEQSWEILPHFKLEDMEKSHMVVEGEDLKLKCRLRAGSVVDENKVTFVWTRLDEFVPAPESDEGTTIDEAFTQTTRNDDIEEHLKVIDQRNQSALKIEDAVPADRAIYRCDVETVIEGEKLTDTVFTLVRVKDKYAALYPFVGIVVEVIALCLIIFLCERRKNSQEVEDDEEEYNGAAPGNGNSNLRQRRT